VSIKTDLDGIQVGSAPCGLVDETFGLVIVFLAATRPSASTSQVVLSWSDLRDLLRLVCKLTRHGSELQRMDAEAG
jgi:hypothetical protein